MTLSKIMDSNAPTAIGGTAAIVGAVLITAGTLGHVWYLALAGGVIEICAIGLLIAKTRRTCLQYFAEKKENKQKAKQEETRWAPNRSEGNRFIRDDVL